jgi:hypothetical protein
MTAERERTPSGRRPAPFLAGLALVLTMTSVGGTTPAGTDAAVTSRRKPDAARPKEPKASRAAKGQATADLERAPRVDAAPPRVCEAGRDASGAYCPLP